MTLSVRPAHLRRYKDILTLLLKYGGSDVVGSHPLDEEALFDDASSEESAGGKPDELADDLESLGPTFVKIGQLLSTRGDLLPFAYLKALARLQDEVDPFPAAEVEAIVADELSVRLSKAFERFDPEPIAAASLGQVHQAVLRNGKAVAVKVQRPNIRGRILDDLEALDEIAEFLDHRTEVGRKYGFTEIFGQFRKSLLLELDYRQEAQNLITLGNNLKRYDRIVVPQPVADYTTSRVLTMDWVEGTKVTALSPLVQIELDGDGLAEQLSKAYLDQVLVDGFFHADPHPGNVLVTDDHRLALIDLGMVAHVAPHLQEQLLRFLLAIAEGEGDNAATISKDIGVRTESFDESRFNREVSDLVLRYQHATMEDVKVGRIVVEIARISGECGVRPAPELTMLGKTLLNLDEVSRVLSPKVSPNDMVRQHADSLLRKRMLKRLSPGQLFSATLEMNEFVQELPTRLNKVLHSLAENRFTIHVESIDELRLLHNVHQVANRLTLSLVFAALIIGAALMMRVETEFTILGYPGIAMILFLIAAACAFLLVLSIVFGEDRSESGKRGS